MFKPATLIIAMAAALSGCQTTNEAPKPVVEKEIVVKQAVNNEAENAKLNVLLEAYFQQSSDLAPMYGTYLGEEKYFSQFDLPVFEARAAYTQLVDNYRKQLSEIDPNKLSGQAKLSYDIISRDLELAVRAREFPNILLPINQMEGLHNELAAFGSGESAQPFNTVADYRAFLARAKGFKPWLESVKEAMRQGTEQGVTLPKPLAMKLVPQFAAHVVYNAEDSLFWQPIKRFPVGFTAAEKAALVAEYKEAIMTDIIPAYRDMAEFLEEVYIPKCRTSVGFSDLPNGKAWYQLQIESHTSLALGADEIHDIGMQEVTRIRSEMEKVREQVGFNGDLQAFFKHLRDSDEFYFDSAEAVIKAYEEVKKTIDAKLPLLFDVAPKADYVVKAVEAFRAESAPGASYQGPSADGSNPGIFYINTFNLKAQPKFIVETLSIHEAAPGHHFQIALQQEIEDLPSFRKFAGYTVFAEGWALYAESLGKEMGLFSDPYMWYGRLVDEQLRAMRLVVDTGLHAKGWSREQAIAFMLENSSMAESDVTAEVERYIAWPGQALSYKLGQFKIRELRDYATSKLGAKFDVKAFHREVLIDGAMPMPILEAKIKAWVAAQL
ncbi:DUF885 domain-containing protein [Pseudoalteromonas fenneropenaei]|uniref:DUF885 domain-containing protein n=1 Tax=Pseudoalteromonas fenneropenaei TaxID=1737459 RepID=A0ABV7CJ22_9GAMM